ncbi:MAG: hypothetical protein AAF449_01650 [Myxococcota bacterium]
MTPRIRGLLIEVQEFATQTVVERGVVRLAQDQIDGPIEAPTFPVEAPHTYRRPRPTQRSFTENGVASVEANADALHVFLSLQGK